MSTEVAPAPRTLEEIDPAWLTWALSRSRPGVAVNGVTFGRSERATGTKIRMMLDYNEAGHRARLPPTMWFKGGYEAHSAHVRTSHARESLFYAEFGPLNLVNAPTCYFAGIDAQTGYGVQLIEDLLQRNVWFGDARRPIDAGLARRALAQLAKLHAYHWNSENLSDLGPVGGSLATDGIVLRIMGDGAWEKAMESALADPIPAHLRSHAGAVAGMERLWALDRSSSTLCMVHGDAHPGNLFFEHDGEPGFLDWQRLMQCDWAHDVAYFLICSMESEACAAAERDLLAFYLDALGRAGVTPPSWEEAWLSYRRHAMYGLVWNVVPARMQPAEVCAAAAARFNAAVRRLDTYEALFS